MKTTLLHLPEGIETSIGDWSYPGCHSCMSGDISLKLSVSQLLQVGAVIFSLKLWRYLGSQFTMSGSLSRLQY